MIIYPIKAQKLLDLTYKSGMKILKNILDLFNKNKVNKPIPIVPDTHSGLRTMLGSAGRTNYQPFEGLEDARKYDNSYVVFEGDYGGQIYLVAPAKQIKCNLEKLKNLLERLDNHEWKDVEGAGIYFEKYKVGDTVLGGMGGGKATKNIWIHKHLSDMEDEIKQILIHNV